MKFVYIRRLSDGRTLDMTEEQAKETLKRGGFELIGEIPMEEKKEEVILNEVKEHGCILCGFVGKNEQSLRMHKRKSHG